LTTLLKNKFEFMVQTHQPSTVIDTWSYWEYEEYAKFLNEKNKKEEEENEKQKKESSSMKQQSGMGGFSMPTPNFKPPNGGFLYFL
jgi:hypothetical protein